MEHSQVIQTMQETLFCLLLPGDSVSSRRAAEIMLAGCIPVFIGPPYHNMPLAEHIDYKAASIFLHVEEILPEAQKSMRQQLAEGSL